MAAPKVKILSPGSTSILAGREVRADLERRIKAIQDACEGESSWGGYFTAVTADSERATAKIWSLSSNLGENHNRHQRMIRNLDAGA